MSTAIEELTGKLNPIISQTANYYPNSLEYRQGLNKIIVLMLNSKALLRSHSPHYEDCLQDTLLAFCRRFQKLARSGNEIDSVYLVRWFNRYLRWRLFDRYREPSHLTFIDNIAVSEGEDIALMLETFTNWIATDPDGKLRQTSMKKYARVTAQVLLQRRFPDCNAWKDISSEFNVPFQSLISFFKRSCVPLLKEFAKREGYGE
jgi:hypothetical protein